EAFLSNRDIDRLTTCRFANRWLINSRHEPDRVILFDFLDSHGTAHKFSVGLRGRQHAHACILSLLEQGFHRVVAIHTASVVVDAHTLRSDALIFANLTARSIE